jgi:hypothetical protein
MNKDFAKALKTACRLLDSDYVADYGSGNFYDIIFTKHGRGL